LMYIGEHCCRVVMNRHIEAHFSKLDRPSFDAVEVSGYNGRSAGWRTFDRLNYPAFDLCQPTRECQYDVAVCEEVLERVANAVAAVRTLFALTRPGGRLTVDMAILIRRHADPGDHWRFTKDGLRLLLTSVGFIATHSWGSSACTIADSRRATLLNLPTWRYCWRAFRPSHSLVNDLDCPVCELAYASRPK
jgi:hypothetical protein